MADMNSPRRRTGTSQGSKSAGAKPEDRPVRVTVDLAPADYDSLRDWAHFARMSHADVLRALVRLLVTDDSVDQQVRASATPRRSS